MPQALAQLMNESLDALGEISLAFKCGPKTSLREAIDTLQGAKIGCLVVSEGPDLLGIITERDILMKIAGRDLDLESICVADFMTKNPVTISRTDTIGDAMRLMVTYNFRHLVVTSSKNNLTQIISIKDLCQYLVKSVDGPSS